LRDGSNSTHIPPDGVQSPAMFLGYDLHSHSTASDGTLTPTALVRAAAAAGVKVLALTDHDNTAGIDEAQLAARESGIQLLPGVEISVTWERQTVHLVGLNFDHKNSALQDGLKALQAFRVGRAEEIALRLGKAGIPDALEGARSFSNGWLVSRTHFARFLVKIGVMPDMRKVFRHYLVYGKPGYVPGEWASLEQAIGWITDAGGQTVIAHPARYRMTRSKLRRLIKAFAAAGGAGLEVVSGSHSCDDCFNMARHAKDFGLLASAGSDYHGPEHPWIELGRLPQLPDGCVPIWRDWGISSPQARAI